LAVTVHGRDARATVGRMPALPQSADTGGALGNLDESAEN